MGDGIRVRVSARLGDGNAESVAGVFVEYLAAEEQTKTVLTGSMGYYDLEPFVIVEKPNAPAICYTGVTENRAADICERWLSGDDPIPEAAFCTLSGEGYKGIEPYGALPIFRLQRRAVSRRCGFTDPWAIENTISEFEGYAGLKQALNMKPGDILEIISNVALLSRDGWGESVFSEWNAFQSISGVEKTIVCSGFDNDIETRIPRLLLEGDPHGIIEGALIAAFAVGASNVVIAVPADTGKILPVLENAISELQQSGFPGNSFPEPGFSCDISIREVPRALISCEKTALLSCLNGLQLTPSLPGKSGDILWGNPALLIGVETLASLPPVLLGGSDFSVSPITGTKLLTLSGGVRHEYTLELPFDISIGTVVREIGEAGNVKAIQVGGLTGVFLNADALDKKIRFETAKEAGADFGLSVINVVPDSACMVKVTEDIMRILHNESCGKCVFCREGTLHLRQMLSDVINRRSDDKDFELMTEICRQMASGCICTLGLTAANPVISSLLLFRPDYERYVKAAHDRRE